MPSVEIVVHHEVGLHARPAAAFVKIANGYPCEIKVTNITAGSPTINAKSILGVLSIGVHQGHTIKIEADGDKSQDALTALEDLIANNFGENVP